MKLFKTVFLVGLATIALGSAAMGETPATGPDAAAPCITSNDGTTKPVQAPAGGAAAPAKTNANGAQNGAQNGDGN